MNNKFQKNKKFSFSKNNDFKKENSNNIKESLKYNLSNNKIYTFKIININIIKNTSKNYNKIIFILINNNLFFLLWYFICIELINPIFAEKNFNNRKLNQIQTIKIKVTYGSRLKIINSDYIPSRIYINGIKSSIDISGYVSIENEGINNVTLEWDKKAKKYSKLFQNINSVIEVDFTNFDISGIQSIKSMFINCENLEYINFNNFDTSSVIDMASMFEGCSNLKSLNLSIFKTLNVKYMESMFKDCISLTSLNLTNFITPNLERIHKTFSGCISLKNLDLPNIDTSLVTNMESLFNDCYSLISLDITNFVTKNVANMFELFKYCSSLKSLDISNFDTSLVTNMGYMFYQCSSLTSINLLNFITSNVENMEYMFYSCRKLTSIDLSTFDTSEVISMGFMFCDCSSLLSIDLSNFSLSQKYMEEFFSGCSSLTSIKFSKEYKLVGKINRMFYQCSSLTSIDLYNFDFALNDNLESLFSQCYNLISLDLSNIDTSSVTNMADMFYGCYSLKVLNIKNIKTFRVRSMNSMFFNCSSLKSIDLSSFNTSLVFDMARLFSGCSKLSSLNLSRFNTSLVIDMKSMFEGCISLTSLDLSTFDTSLVTNMNSMFYRCTKLISLDLSHFIMKNVDNIDYIFYQCKNLEFINIYNFSDGIITQFNDLFGGLVENIIYCIKNESDAQQIISQLSSKKCSFNDCSKNWKNKRKKIIFKENICLDECLENEKYKYEYEYYCYEKCPKGSHPSKDNIFFCKKNIYECVSKYPFINLDDKSCLEECNCREFFENMCTINTINIESRSFLISNIIEGIQEGLIDYLLEKIINEEKEDILKTVGDTLYQITSSFNQNNKYYKNISTIKLGECENILKERYNIPEEENLIIFKTEQYINGLYIPFIDFYIFSQNNKMRLDLEICKNSNIDIFIPVYINENILYQYETNHSYYNDICYTFTTDDGLDIILYDRQSEFNKNNMSLCYNNCVYNGYDSVNKNVMCHCQIQDRINFLSEINKDGKLYKFLIKKSLTNLGVLKCYHLLFSKSIFIKNLGNDILLLITLIHILSGIFVFAKGYDLLLNQINDILNVKILEAEKENSSSRKEFKFESQLKENTTDILSSSNKNQVHVKNNKLSKNFSIETKIDSEISFDNKLFKKKFKNKKIENDEANNIMTYIDYEINTIQYQDAIIIDKRTYCQYFISLLKLKIIFIFVFNPKKDYNIYIIKICLFFFYIVLHLVMNALFFNDSMMHRIYENKKKYIFIYDLPSIIYSLIISSIIFVLIKKLFLTQNNILRIKHEKNKSNLNSRVIIELKKINIKIICFFIFSIIFLLFFWYYLSCFCAVYENTQLYLIKNSLISYVISLILPFITSLFPGIFRISSFKEPGICLYKISQIFQCL